MIRCLLFLLLAGCSTPGPKYTSPSTAPVRHSVVTAQEANTSAQAHNTTARTLADRIDAKDAVIDQWHREHPGQ